MNTFGPSQELVEILLKNGFKDDTKTYYPDHYALMAQTGYDPSNIKRKFSFHSHADFILFDYINFIPMVNNTRATRHSFGYLSVNELKSIICFYKLPIQEKKRIKSEIHKIYEKYIENYYLTEEKHTLFEIKIKSLYDSILL